MPVARPSLGVLGGSFNPPHLGHLVAASVACGQLGLERVLFVPAARPPHKTIADATEASVRLEMTMAATASDERFAACSIEIDDDLVYTSDLLAALGVRHPGHELVFILGSDSLLQLADWHQPEAIVRQARLAVAPRPGDDDAAITAAMERWGADRVTVLDMPPLAVSSTDVRRRVRAGSPVRYLVPDAVDDLIVARGLYGT